MSVDICAHSDRVFVLELESSLRTGSCMEGHIDGFSFSLFRSFVRSSNKMIVLAFTSEPEPIEATIRDIKQEFIDLSSRNQLLIRLIHYSAD